MKDIAKIKVYIGGHLVTEKNVTDEMGVSVDFGPKESDHLIKVEAEAIEKKEDAVTGYMNECLKPASIWSHLSQEAAELSVAANKVAMKLREKEDGDPVKGDLSVLISHSREEYTDVVQLANELHIEEDEGQMRLKALRFRMRREELKNRIDNDRKVDSSLFSD